MKDGSRSDCQAGVASEQECQELAQQGGYDMCYWIPNADSGCDGILPWSRETCQGNHPYYPDDQTPPHAPMVIKWRFVVVVDCEDSGDDCIEHHHLMKCGRDHEAVPPHD